MSAFSRIEENESLMSLFLENITLNKYSLHLIVTTKHVSTRVFSIQ